MEHKLLREDLIIIIRILLYDLAFRIMALNINTGIPVSYFSLPEIKYSESY